MNSKEMLRLRLNANNRKRRAEIRTRLAALKVERGCADCGYNAHACALDFDHRDPTTKCFSIGQCGTMSDARIDAEVAKCDVVCATCHRVRTYIGDHTCTGTT